MTTRTRARTADKADKGDAAPEQDAEQPVEQPADEAQTERTAEQPGQDLAARLDDIARVLGQVAEREQPPADLAEVHDRFDVLSAEIGAIVHGGTSPVPDVLGKVLAVMREVDEIGKGGKAPDKMGGYAFRKVDTAIDAVGAAVRRVGLVLRSEVVEAHMFGRKVGSNADSWGARVTMRYVFVSPVDGSEHAIEGVGEGADSGDKATSKASSMALKYALLQGLMIPVEGVHLDVEAEDTRSAPPSRQQERPQRGTREADAGTYRREREQHEQAQGQRQAPPSRERPAQGEHDPSQDPPEVRAAEVLRRANSGYSAERIQALLGKASDAGLAEVEIESFGHRATLQQHLLATIRLARQGEQQ